MDNGENPLWEIELYEDHAGDVPFEKWLEKQDDYTSAVTLNALDFILKRLGKDIVESEWGRALGDGLYEFRIRRSLQAVCNAAGITVPPEFTSAKKAVLLRVFVAFYGQRIVLLLHAYDKKRDPSERRQNREIKKARKLLADWKRRAR